jgi:DNA-directed RNA polymerase specialized sigma24 family protein
MSPADGGLDSASAEGCRVPPEVAGQIADAYRKHARGLTAYARRWLGDRGLSRDLAEDMVHQAFVDATPRWATIANPRAYLYTCVHHRVAGEADKAKAVAVSSAGDALEAAGEGRWTSTVPTPTAEDRLRVRKVEDEVRNLARTAPSQAATFYQHALQDIPQQAIAKADGRAASTIANGFRSAFKKINEKVGGGSLYGIGGVVVEVAGFVQDPRGALSRLGGRLHSRLYSFASNFLSTILPPVAAAMAIIYFTAAYCTTATCVAVAVILTGICLHAGWQRRPRRWRPRRRRRR